MFNLPDERWFYYPVKLVKLNKDGYVLTTKDDFDVRAHVTISDDFGTRSEETKMMGRELIEIFGEYIDMELLHVPEYLEPECRDIIEELIDDE